MIELILTISGITATLLLCLHKWGAFEYYEVHRPIWLTWEVCTFCIGFWISVLLTVLFGHYEGYIPFACASFSFAIYKICMR